MNTSATERRLDQVHINTIEGKTITVIICFSYLLNVTYMFDEMHVRRDLLRILSFTLNKVGNSLNDIYILTDIIPNTKICDDNRADFKNEVDHYFYGRGFQSKIDRSKIKTDNLMDWLYQSCGQVASYFNNGVPSKQIQKTLFKQAKMDMLPTISNTDVIEFASLFTNFVLISGRKHFHETLSNIFNSLYPNDHLFFYYTGHGIRSKRLIRLNPKTRNIHLVIPVNPILTGNVYKQRRTVDHGSLKMIKDSTIRRTVEYYPKKLFGSLVKQIKSQAFFVFDCCYAGSILNLRYKITLSSYGKRMFENRKSTDLTNILCLASSQSDQTCGFCLGKDGHGSVFTYFLIKHLNEISGNQNETGTTERDRQLSNLYTGVEEKVEHYRNSIDKPPQNILILSTSLELREIPDWLFAGKDSKIIEMTE